MIGVEVVGRAAFLHRHALRAKVIIFRRGAAAHLVIVADVIGRHRAHHFLHAIAVTIVGVLGDYPRDFLVLGQGVLDVVGEGVTVNWRGTNKKPTQ